MNYNRPVGQAIDQYSGANIRMAYSTEDVVRPCENCSVPTAKSTKQFLSDQESGAKHLCSDCRSLNSIRVCSTPFCKSHVRTPSRTQTNTSGEPIRVCEICNHLARNGVDLNAFGDTPQAASRLFYDLEENGEHTVPGMLTTTGNPIHIALPQSIFNRVQKRNNR